jgi:hypothetical protein
VQGESIVVPNIVNFKPQAFLDKNPDDSEELGAECTKREEAFWIDPLLKKDWMDR